MTQLTSVDRHSSVVSLQLHVGSNVYPLSQVGPDFVVLPSAAVLPPGPATVIMVVDGNERKWGVTILESDGPSEIIRTKAA